MSSRDLEESEVWVDSLHLQPMDLEELVAKEAQSEGVLFEANSEEWESSLKSKPGHKKKKPKKEKKKRDESERNG